MVKLIVFKPVNVGLCPTSFSFPSSSLETSAFFITLFSCLYYSGRNFNIPVST